MSEIRAALLRFRTEPEIRPGPGNPFHLVSRLAGPAAMEDIEAAWPGVRLPAELTELWREAGEARLFADSAYGQWGLALLNPKSSAARTSRERASRPADFAVDDIVIGEFLGDQDLLVVSPSESEGSKIQVALPLDGRADWYSVASSLGEFLEAYFAASGEKFWE